jgi:hypothetical protein
LQLLNLPLDVFQLALCLGRSFQMGLVVLGIFLKLISLLSAQAYQQTRGGSYLKLATAWNAQIL